MRRNNEWEQKGIIDRRKRNSINRRNRRMLNKITRKTGAMLLVLALLAGSVGGKNLLASGWNDLDTQTQALVQEWVSLSEAEQLERWSTYTTEEQDAIWSLANEDGVIELDNLGITEEGFADIEEDGTYTVIEGTSDYTIEPLALGNTHSTVRPSWCYCDLDTGVRSIVLNDSGYVKSFERVLAPTGAPSTAYRYGTTTPATNRVTPTWNLSAGHLLNFGFYGTAAITNRILDTNHTQGYVYDFTGTQSLASSSVYLVSDGSIFERVYASTNTASNANWTNSTLRTYLNNTNYVANVGIYNSYEQSAINATSLVASSSDYGEPYAKTIGRDFATTDKVFLLSTLEATGYYETEVDRSKNSGYTRTRMIKNPSGDAATNAWVIKIRPDANANANATFSAGWFGSGGCVTEDEINPALNLNLASISHVSGAGVAKGDFGATAITGYTGTGATETLSRTWDTTLVGGTGFSATATTASTIKVGGSITVSIPTKGTQTTGTAYNQISATIVDQYGMVVMYGKVGSSTDTSVTINVPTGILDAGTYDLKLFAESVNSSSNGTLTHKTDYASNMVSVGTVISDTVISDTVDFSIDESYLTYADRITPESDETITQVGIPVNSDVGEFIYEAHPGFFFDETYTGLGTCNGITVELVEGTDNQIRVSGIAENNTVVVLPAAQTVGYRVTFEQKASDGVNWVTYSEHDYNVTTPAGSIQIPMLPDSGGYMLKYWYWAAKGDQEEYRIYPGTSYEMPLDTRVYRAVYGPVTSIVLIDVNLDTDPNDYNFDEHGMKISLHNSVGAEIYSTIGPDRDVIENNINVKRAYIPDVENGTYSIYMTDTSVDPPVVYDTSASVVVNSTVDRTYVNADVYFYTASFDFNDDDVTETVEYRILNGYRINTADIPEITNEAMKPSFKYWSFTNSLSSIDYDQDLVIKGTTRYIARYTLPQYSVTFVEEDGVTVFGDKSGVYDVGSIIEVPDGPYVEGKGFSYWVSKDISPQITLYPYMNGEQNYYTVQAKDVVFEPVYGKNTTTIQLDITLDGIWWENHGKVFTLVDLENGIVHSIDNDYQFVGVPDGNYEIQVNGESVGKTVTTLATNPSGNYAVVEMPFWTVTYDYNNGGAIPNMVYQVLEYRDAPVPGTTPTKYGYTFSHWEGDATYITEPTTLVAQYSSNPYTIRFEVPDEDEVDGYILLEEISAAYNDVISSPTESLIPAISGKQLHYWQAVESPSTRIYSPWTYKVDASNMTFRPVYTDATANIDLNVYLDDEKWTNHDKTFILRSTTTGVDYTGVTGTSFVNLATGDYKVYEVVTTYDSEGVETGTNNIDLGLTVTASVLPSVLQPDIDYYTVNYLDDTNGNEFVEEQIIYKGKNAVQPTEIPTKPGAEFLGWDRVNTNITSPTVIVPIWDTDESYRVTFRDWDYTQIKQETLLVGSEIIAPADPVREHYIFIGWDPEYVVGDTMPSKDVVYTAVYEVDETDPPVDDPDADNNIDVLVYLDDVKWEDHGKNFVLKVDGTANVSYILEDGMFKDVEDGTYLVYERTDSGDVNLGLTVTVVNGKSDDLIIDYYTVRYLDDIDGNDWIDPQIVYKGSSAVTPAINPTKSGTNFAGWDRHNYDIQGPTVIEPIWGDELTYRLTFRDWDGTAIKQEYLSEGEAIVAPEDPTREHYIFKGWDPEYSEDDTMPNTDKVYTAIYEVDPLDPPPVDEEEGFKIIVYLDDVKWENHGKTYYLSGSGSNNYTSVDGIFTNVEDGVYRLYEFIGSTQHNLYIEVTVSGGSADTVILNYYTVRYLDDVGGDDWVDVQYIFKGWNATVPTGNPTKEGYTFKGWTRDKYDIEGPRIIEPIWDESNDHRLTFRDWDGTAIKQEYLAEGDEIVAPADPEREHYIFKGWDPEYNEGDTMPGSDMVYTAVYDIDDENPPTPDPDEEDPRSISITVYLDDIRWTDHDKTFVLRDNSSAAYAFTDGAVHNVLDGTYKIYELVGGVYIDLGLTVVIDGELVNKVEIDYYTVRYLDDVDGDDWVDPQIIYKGFDAVEPEENPTKDDNTFTGWDRDNLIILGPTVIEPIWGYEGYRVTFRDYDGTILSQETLPVGAEILEPDVQEREHYIFKGWSPEYNVGDTMTAEDRVYVAVYEVDENNPPIIDPPTPDPDPKEKVYVTFAEQDGTPLIGYPIEVFVGDIVTAPDEIDVPSFVGKEIDYWISTEEPFIRLYAPWEYVTDSRDITFIPVYKENTSNVTIEVLLDDETWVGHGKTFVLRDRTSGQTYTMSNVENVFTNIPMGQYEVVEITSNGNLGLGVYVTVNGLSDSESPVFPIKYYTVTYLDDVDGNKWVADQIVYTGQHAVEPTTVPTKEGCTFLKWSDDSYNIRGTSVIYPVWSEDGTDPDDGKDDVDPDDVDPDPTPDPDDVDPDDVDPDDVDPDDVNPEPTPDPDDTPPSTTPPSTTPPSVSGGGGTTNYNYGDTNNYYSTTTPSTSTNTSDDDDEEGGTASLVPYSEDYANADGTIYGDNYYGDAYSDNYDGDQYTDGSTGIYGAGDTDNCIYHKIIFFLSLLILILEHMYLTKRRKKQEKQLDKMIKEMRVLREEEIYYGQELNQLEYDQMNRCMY